MVKKSTLERSRLQVKLINEAIQKAKAEKQAKGISVEKLPTPSANRFETEL